MIPNQVQLNPEDYEHFRIPQDSNEMLTVALGMDPYKGEPVGIGFEDMKANVLFTIPEGQDMFSTQVVQAIPPHMSALVPVSERNLYACITSLSPTHNIRVVAPGDVGNETEKLPLKSLRRVTMESLFVQSPAKARKGQDPLRFSPAGLLAKAVEYFSYKKGLLPEYYIPALGASSWPVVAQLLRAIVMHMAESQKNFEDSDILEWIRARDPARLRAELTASSNKFVSRVFLPDEDLTPLREILYRSLLWIHEYDLWKSENFQGPVAAEVMDFEELRKGNGPTAALILVPKLGIDTPAWFGRWLALVYAKAEVEILGNQHGRPVVWVNTPETIMPGLTDLIKYL